MMAAAAGHPSAVMRQYSGLSGVGGGMHPMMGAGGPRLAGPGGVGGVGWGPPRHHPQEVTLQQRSPHQMMGPHQVMVPVPVL